MAIDNLIYFVLGVALTIALSPQFQGWWKKRRHPKNLKQANSRMEELVEEEKKLARYQKSPSDLIVLLLVTLLLVNTLWVAQDALTNVSLLATSAIYGLGSILRPFTYIDGDLAGNVANLAQSLLSVIFLAAIFRIGWRAYATGRRVVYYEKWLKKIEKEKDSIREKIAKLTSEAESKGSAKSGAPDSEAPPSL